MGRDRAAEITAAIGYESRPRYHKKGPVLPGFFIYRYIDIHPFSALDP